MAKLAAITGATGFVGKHLLRELVLQGFQVNALTRRIQPETKNINWIEGDLENKSALANLIDKADIVIHLAGLIKAKSPEAFFSVNSHSVKSLIEAVEKSKSKPHFILLSSLAARERHLSDYAESKRRGEDLLIEHAGDIPWTILRPPGIYGPEDMETLKIFKSLASRIAPLPGSAKNRTSWVYAPDLAKAILAVSESQNCFGQILDVDDGTENGYSNQDLYHTASEMLNVRAFQFVVPKVILKNIAQFNVLFSTIFGYTPMITPKKVNELCHPDWICRGPHVMKMTNWKPETDLKKGLKNTLNWYKDNNYV